MRTTPPLDPGDSQRAREPYRVKPHHAQLRPGFDCTGLNRLADELEDEALVEKHIRQRG
jgi:hypothetical protein